ncbi:MAG: hypothetical protein JWP27_2474 [Flaviaesturariibacter sp.]|nr:hypothetical protein [Flaviaesturariibacter sp.]
MTAKPTIAALCFFLFTSCHGDRGQHASAPPTPKALEDKSSSFEFSSKRGDDDLVERLYREQLDKDADLQKLENKIDALNDSKTDSTNAFDRYNSKSESYFSAADRHLREIHDSVLKQTMRTMLANSLAKYNALTGRHTALLATIQLNQVTISDLRNSLQILRTLPVMEKYQAENLPGTTPLKGFTRWQEDAIRLADTLRRK